MNHVEWKINAFTFCAILYIFIYYPTQFAADTMGITDWKKKTKNNHQDRLYLLCLWYMHTAQRDGFLYCIRVVILFFLYWKSFAKDFSKRLIENTEALIDPLLYRQFFVNILIYMSSYICMQACILFFTLYVAACNGRLQCWGDNGRGCVRGCTCNCLLSQ